MGKIPKNPGRRFQVLALLDGVHPPPQDIGVWSAAAVARVCGISGFSALHLLARARKYGIVEGRESIGSVAFVKRPGLQGPRQGTLPVRTLVWSLTPKGVERLKYAGGHAKWCTICPRMRAK